MKKHRKASGAKKVSRRQRVVAVGGVALLGMAAGDLAALEKIGIERDVAVKAFSPTRAACGMDFSFTAEEQQAIQTEGGKRFRTFIMNLPVNQKVQFVGNTDQFFEANAAAFTAMDLLDEAATEELVSAVFKEAKADVVKKLSNSTTPNAVNLRRIQQVADETMHQLRNPYKR